MIVSAVLTGVLGVDDMRQNQMIKKQIVEKHHGYCDVHDVGKILIVVRLVHIQGMCSFKALEFKLEVMIVKEA